MSIDRKDIQTKLEKLELDIATMDAVASLDGAYLPAPQEWKDEAERLRKLLETTVTQACEMAKP